MIRRGRGRGGGEMEESEELNRGEVRAAAATVDEGKFV